MDYTPEQQAAITTHDRNVIVTAGAGSGKTRVLVDRYLALLETNPDWPLASLVAITFTEKAAREMRDRVRQAVETRIAEAESAGDPAGAHFWHDRGAAIDSARIGTIHSLCGAILRANAAEIGIDPRFDILDEVQSAILIEEAVESTLQSLIEGQSHAGRLLLEYGVGPVRSTLRERIATPDAWLDHLNVDSESTHRLYREHIHSVITRLAANEAFHEALYWEPESWPTADRMLDHWLMIRSQREVIYRGDPDAIRVALAEWGTTIKLVGGAAKAWGSKETLDTAKALLRAIRDQAQAALAEIGVPPGADDDRAAELAPLWADAIRQARDAYRKLKTAKLDFDDLETLTCELLAKPGVAARYQGTEFKHLLVDEFQDTNEAQRQIIYALAEPDRPGSLFVVGDPKQSIYQFRGADVSVFGRVREDIETRGGETIELATSFRTHTRLVDGFNAIFGQLLRRGDGPMAAYEVELGAPMTAQRATPPDLGPALEIILINKESAEEDRRDADQLRRWEAWQLVQSIERRRDQPVWDKAARSYRPLDYGDIGVLFQARRAMPLVEEVFKAANVPYIALGGVGYYHQPEVWDLQNLLRALYNPADALALAAVLHSPLYNLSDNDLFRLRLDPARPLWDTLLASAGTGPVGFAGSSLAALHAIAGRVTIAELLTRTLDETGYMAAIAGLPGGDRRCANVDKFVELARAGGQIGLGAFTAYVGDLTEREVREGEAPVEPGNAVQLMTVHASKGLEFPVVCLFDCTWTGWDRTPPLLLDRDPAIGAGVSLRDEDGKVVEPFLYRRARRYLGQREDAERLRLLYVGMTRAQDYLILTGHVNNLEATGGDHWIARLLDALAITAPADGEWPQDWGTVRLTVPGVQPSEEDLAPRPDDVETGWELLTDEPVAGVPSLEPPLLKTIVIDRHAPARNLTATTIAQLGDSKAVPDLARFRYHVLRDAPVYVARVEPSDDTRLKRRAIGEMVHRALQWGRLPSLTTDLETILTTYGWGIGLTDTDRLKGAVREATNLLRKTEQDAIIRQIASAEEVYRELPFVFTYRGRTINGVIDVLIRSHADEWTIIDYKTSSLRRGEEAESHAQRYYAQVGVYAAAVEALLGRIPATYIHYIRYAKTVLIATETWRQALEVLDQDIRTALGEE
ncbi:MAG TPA: UvrD-helicase domain-containing protein [Aggregatilineales bacterium]|nr:UvrD-helicase domain-containing protein [Aggregatilineales bacterium]